MVAARAEPGNERVTEPRHRRAKEVFLAARGLERDERASFVARVCGDDDELRREVESLLDYRDTETRHFSALLVEAVQIGREACDERFQAGAAIAGRYRIVRRLGSGGMGEVYLAEDEKLGELVALKFLPRAFASVPASLELLLAEARAARGVSHPNICRVYDVGEAEGETFVSMEYIEGEDLAGLLRRTGAIPSERARKMALELCSALAAAHESGVLHRDLKPANVLVDASGRLHVADFGLAGRDEERARAGVAAGSPAYMAPELLAGGAPSVQSDLFALGLVLFEILAGRRAYDSPGAIRGAALAGDPPPSPREQASDVDPVLARAIQLCLDSDPARRPRSAAALARALGEEDPLAGMLALGDVPTPAVVAASGARGVVSARAAPRLALVALILLALFVPLSDRTFPLQRARPARAPSELAGSARDLLRRLDPLDALPSDSAYGLSASPGPTFFGPGRESWESWGGPGTGAALVFWYREGLDELKPSSMWTLFFLRPARTHLDDPPAGTQGTSTVILDLEGRLRFLRSTPEFVPPRAGAFDWGPLFAAAGLDPLDFEPAGTLLPLESAADRRLAWVSRGEPHLRVEAGSSAGRAVLFALLRRVPFAGAPAGPAGVEGVDPVVLSHRIYDRMLALLLAFAIPMAWRNLRAGRGDPWGGFRLALFTLVCRMASWLLQADHARDLSSEMSYLVIGFGAGLWQAAMAWGYYMAIEPLVRGFWPKALVSWNRVLGGRWRDPLVAGHVLIGACFGIWLALCDSLDVLLPQWLGRPVESVPPADALDALSGPASWVGTVLGLPVDALYTSLLVLMLLAFLRAVLRHTLLAAAVAAALLTAIDALLGADPLLSWPVVALLQVAPGLYLLLRLGVIPYCAAQLVLFLLEGFPITAGLERWYAGASLFALACVLLVLGGALLGVLRPAARSAGRIPAPGVRSGGAAGWGGHR